MGGAFFLVLAPNSSVIPIKDLMFEHRMYLPLAAVVVLVVTTGYRCTERIRARLAAGSRRDRGIALARPALVALAALVFGLLTVAHNHDYRSARACTPTTARCGPTIGPALESGPGPWGRRRRQQAPRPSCPGPWTWHPAAGPVVPPCRAARIARPDG